MSLYQSLANITQQHWGLTLSAELQQQFSQFYTLLMDHNSRINLVRVPDESTFVTRHLLDSLTLWPLLKDLPKGSRIVDVGSGGGMPLIPMALVRPDLRWHSIEATQKKVVCLQAMATQLGLSIQFHADRLEALNTQPKHKGQYKVVTARAVASLDKLLPWVSPLLAPQGRILAMKGQKAQTELAAALPLLKKLKRRCVSQLVWPEIPELQDATILVFV